MNFVKIAAMAFGLVLVSSVSTFAQGPGGTSIDMSALGPGLKAIGIGLAILGGGMGIGRIVGSAVESMARQPEMAPTIQTNMLIGAALVEGAALAALGVIAFVM